MTSRDFCYWLQGFFELSNSASLNKEQVKAIKAHLNMVFAHEIDPSHGTPEHREELQDLHDQIYVGGRDVVEGLVLLTVKASPGLGVPDLVKKLGSTVSERDTRATVQRMVQSGLLSLDRNMKLQVGEDVPDQPKIDTDTERAKRIEDLKEALEDARSHPYPHDTKFMC